MNSRVLKNRLLLLVLFNITLNITTLCQAAQRYQFNLPPMEAATALELLADKSGYSLIYPFNISSTLRVNPVIGEYSLSDALEILLYNSPLNAIATEKGVIAVSIKPLDDNNNNSEQLNMKFFANNKVSEKVNKALKTIASNKEGIKMAMEHINNPIFSMQFHPESILTPTGLQMLKNWVAQYISYE